MLLHTDIYICWMLKGIVNCAGPHTFTTQAQAFLEFRLSGTKEKLRKDWIDRHNPLLHPFNLRPSELILSRNRGDISQAYHTVLENKGADISRHRRIT